MSFVESKVHFLGNFLSPREQLGSWTQEKVHAPANALFDEVQNDLKALCIQSITCRLQPRSNQLWKIEAHLPYLVICRRGRSSRLNVVEASRKLKDHRKRRYQNSIENIDDRIAKGSLLVAEGSPRLQSLSVLAANRLHSVDSHSHEKKLMNDQIHQRYWIL